jgi:hypothetical protein
MYFDSYGYLTTITFPLVVDYCASSMFFMMSIANAIEAVKAISSDIVILPESQTYDDIIKSYFTELARELKPAAFLCPESVSHVSNIIRAMRPFANGLKIAICGTGQQATPGVANVRDGLTIHLRNLKGVEVDLEKEIVAVAAGETWGNVFDKVSASGFGVVGQRHSSGGIGGDAVQGKYLNYVRPSLSDHYSWTVVLFLLSWLRV